MKIDLPEPCLVVLIGASGSGKSTFAAQHFLPTEVISSDFCRGLVADDPNDQAATEDAFAVLHEIAGRRLRRGRLTVVDATNVQREAREALMQVVREHDLFALAVVLDLPGEVCAARNVGRPDRDFGEHVIRRQRSQLKRSLRHLQREGFRRSWVLKSEEDVAGVEFTRSPMWTDQRAQLGPFDIIGDVHGCYDELVALLASLGYVDGVHPDGRRAGLRRRPRGPRAGRRAGAAAGDADGGRRHRALRAGQPRRQARAQARRPRRADHPRPRGLARAARRRAAGVRRERRGVPARARLARGAGRGAARRRPRGHAGALPGPRLPPRPRVRVVRRDDGGDGRVRAPDPRGLGDGLPGQRDRRLRPHAGARAGVAQQHDQHRHRLRLRRQADRVALAGAFAGLGAGGARALRARAAVPGRAARGAPAPPARPGGRRGQAHRPDPALAHGHDQRGERRRRAGGHEPLRGRPALARLPAADDGADRDLRPRGRPGVPRRGVRRVPHRGRGAGRLRGEAHGLARDRGRLPRRGRRARALRRRGPRRALHAHRAAVPRRRTAGAGADPRRDLPRRAVGRPGLRLARARLRAAAVVGEGDGADPAPVRRRRRGGPDGARRHRRDARDRRGARVGRLLAAGADP